MSDKKKESVGNKEFVIILAAGSSSRLGQPKQLVKVQGLPLLLKSTMAALEASYSKVVVVLGANADENKKSIAHLPLEIITNLDWEKGMGSSLKAGLQHIITIQPQTTAVVIMVCDQPLLTSAHLKALREVYRISAKPIIASLYKDILGVPALFDQSLFAALMKIKDTQGAKAVIESNPDKVEMIDWADGQFDIDTPDDLKLLNSFLDS